MARYEINGGHPLNGTVTISGAKNAAVAILPAALLVSGKCRIENVPNISDVRILLSILDGMGAKLASPEPGVVEIDCTDIQCSEPDQQLVRRMRASYYPVSYTHLDVYKRQPSDSRPRKCSALPETALAIRSFQVSEAYSVPFSMDSPTSFAPWE